MVELLFLLAVSLTVCLYHLFVNREKRVLFFILLWSILHSILALTGFYHETDSFPPRFSLVLIPVFIFIIYSIHKGLKSRVESSIETCRSTLLHSVRIPVEVVLYLLYVNGEVPKLMTFEGRNFDIIVGLSAPIIYWLYKRKIIGKFGLLVWNVIGLFFVLFILVNGVLSARLPFQLFGIEQPNVAVEFFPFILLPAVVVPLVIVTHIRDIIKIRKEMRI